MKVKLNPAFEAMSGDLGELIFREVRGKTVVSRKSTMTVEPSPDQIAHRERFRLAVAYGRSVMSKAQVRALYEEVARRRNVPVFSLTIADFFNAPTIHSVDLFEYHGQTGDVIHVMASDDFGVENVHVSIFNGQGETIESGSATETEAGSGHWFYTATSTLFTGTEITIRAVATDRPCGTAVKTHSFQF